MACSSQYSGVNEELLYQIYFCYWSNKRMKNEDLFGIRYSF